MLKEKIKILKHHQNFINLMKDLNNLDEQLLRKPIAEGKWSIIEIIAHFYPWDEFILQHRIPYLFMNKHLPKSPNTKDLNTKSASLARTEDIEIIFKKCIHIRNRLLNQIKQIPDDNWLIEFHINQSSLTLYKYLNGLMKHNLHHIKQIKSTLKLN